MDPLHNPYRPGAGAPPPMLAGRDDEAEAIETLLGRLERGMGERSIVLTGLRGVGKTALLLQAERRAEERGWIVQTIEARRGLDFAPAIAQRASVVLRRLEERGALREALARIAALIRRISVREPASGLEVSLDLGAPETGGKLEADLVELFRALGEAAADAETGVLLLLDELQLAGARELEALCAAAHELSKRELPLAVVAAGLPPLRDRLLAAKTYAERLFAYAELGPLDPAAAAAALAEPARTALPDGPEVDFDEPALGLLLAASAGYPYFIQVYGHAAWDEAEAPAIGQADAERALERGRRELDADLYGGRWARANDSGKRYMLAMAELGDGPVRSGEVAERAGFGSHSGAAPTRDQLLEHGLIFSPRRGLVEFTVPGFADHIRRSSE